MTSQYETNLWSTHTNIVRLAEPITRCVRWRTQVFKIEGLVCKRFPPSPLPSFIFWLSFHFSRGQNWISRSSVFFCSETKRKRLLRRLRNTPHKRCQSPPPRRQFDENCHFFLQKAGSPKTSPCAWKIACKYHHGERRKIKWMKTQHP